MILQGIAIPVILLVAWGKKLRWLRLLAALILGIGSAYYLEINLLDGMLSWINSGIALLNQCYQLQISSIVGTTDRISLFWILCVMECLFGIVFLDILKNRRGRFGAVFAFLIPVLLGIVFGKLPEVKEGCFLIVAIFLFLIVSHQREGRVPVLALASAVVVLGILFLGANAVESQLYDYKTGHMNQYREVKKALIQARNIDVTDWLPEQMKQQNGGSDTEEESQCGIDWEQNFSQLSHVDQTGEIIDEVVVSQKPIKTVYYAQFVFYSIPYFFSFFSVFFCNTFVY